MTTPDDLPPLPDELEAYFGPAGSYKPGTDDDHVAFISIHEMQAYARLAIEADRKKRGAELEDQTKWAAHYARRASDLFDVLLALEQAYSNPHSPQHRAACLAEAKTVLAGFDARPTAAQPEPAAKPEPSAEVGLVKRLRDADRRGVSPPQNWTTEAADALERLVRERDALAAAIRKLAEGL